MLGNRSKRGELDREVQLFNTLCLDPTFKVILVTGGNTGLGYHAAEEFARRGAEKVILACRNTEKGNEAAEKIKSLTGHENVYVLQLDLANLENIRNFVSELEVRFPPIDSLVCNAGVWFPMDQGAKTDDGFEMNVGVNHLGHFLLTNLLISKIKRVVLVSSGLMMSGKSNCHHLVPEAIIIPLQIVTK